ncbi:MAG: FCD domain-containing protein, partial [Angustibacter sp.]
RPFHAELHSLPANNHLQRVVGARPARSRLYGLEQLASRGDLAAFAREHEELIDLVLARDARGATKVMKHHIRHVRGSWAGLPED